VNHLPRSKKLKLNSTLLIPVQGRSLAAKIDRQADEEALRSASTSLKKDRVIATDEESASTPAGKTKLVYKTKKGEKLTVIAKRFAVRMTDIRIWNDIAYGKTVRAGAKITLFVPNSKVSTYAAIAGVSVEQRDSHGRRVAVRDEGAAASGAPVAAASVHKVKSGETLKKIAHDADVSIEDLKAWNHLSSSVIKIGQKLKVQGPEQTVSDNTTAKDKPEVTKPQAKEKTVAAKTEVSSGKAKQASTPETHLVKKAETLEKIAKDYGVTVDELKKWNELRTSRINAGDELIVSGKRSGSTNETGEAFIAKKTPKKNGTAKQTFLTYSVKRGDTLERISKKFDVEVAQLMKWNDLSSPKIKAGDKIKIQQNVD
jgi:LysM repeat protein